MFVKVVDNPAGGTDSREATWFKKRFGAKATTLQERNKTPEQIQILQIQQTNLQIQMHHTQKELAELCEKFNRLTQEIAKEGRKNQPEHRRLEVDEE